MLYLGTSPAEPDVQTLLDQHRIGLMCQPASNRPRSGWVWAADNGCFNEKTFHYGRWLDWLYSPLPRTGCLFAVVPDVVGDHAATLDRFWQAIPDMPHRYPWAFVGQDGATAETVPWGSFDCFFVGGTTEWKMGAAFSLAAEARERGKWVHVGRINSNSRYQAWAPFADSCDGTFLAFGPKANTPRLTAWLENAEREPTIWAAALPHSETPK